MNGVYIVWTILPILFLALFVFLSMKEDRDSRRDDSAGDPITHGRRRTPASGSRRDGSAGAPTAMASGHRLPSPSRQDRSTAEVFEGRYHVL